MWHTAERSVAPLTRRQTNQKHGEQPTKDRVLREDSGGKTGLCTSGELLQYVPDLF